MADSGGRPDSGGRIAATTSGRVLVPVDFSQASARAVQEALRVVDSPKDVAVVHVVSSGQFAETGWLLGRLDEAEARAAAKRQLDQFVADYPGVESCLLFGQPADAITRFAEEAETGLIVIPMRSHGLERWLLGSVTKRVVDHAPCDVLVLPREAG